MLTMTQAHDIRKLYFEEGKRISEIARETKHDRKTVRYYIEKDNWNQELPVAVQEPSYPKLDPFKQDIDSWLEEDKRAKRKQRHTARRVYDRLIEKYGDGFDCSYRTVAGYVAMKKKEIFGKRTGYLPLEHIPGEAQVDFGDAEFYENGHHYPGKYLNLSFPYSNQGYLQLFKGENQECLFEGLRTIFEYIGGVPIRIWFDNASTMVTRVMKNSERSLTEGFSRFREHYRFEAAFCNPNAGHEKGNIEGKVGYHRRNLLVPVPKFNDLKEFNKDLLIKCDDDAKRAHYRKDMTIVELHMADRKALLEMPATAFEACKYITVKTNGYGRFYLNNNMHEYSVSPKYANTRVLIKMTAFEVSVLDESHREIVKHQRLYGDHKQQSMQWLPYLTQLSRYPGALKYTGIYQMLPDPVQEYLEKCTKSEKGKLLRAIATLTEKSGFEKAVETIGAALSYAVTDIDSLHNLHNRLHAKVVQFDPVKLQAYVPQLKRYVPDFAAYDKNLGEAGEPKC
jgi:transposase